MPRLPDTEALPAACSSQPSLISLSGKPRNGYFQRRFSKRCGNRYDAGDNRHAVEGDYHSSSQSRKQRAGGADDHRLTGTNQADFVILMLLAEGAAR